MTTIKCDISTVSKIDDDLLFMNIEEDKEFELKDFLQLKDAAYRIGNGDRFYKIINVGMLTSPNSEARLASASEKGCEYKKADAFVIYSLAQKIVANIYLKFNKPHVPTKFFNDVVSAKKWLNELKRAEYGDSHQLSILN